MTSSAEQQPQRSFTGDFAAGRQKPPSILKAAGFPLAPRAFQLVEDAPRSGAYGFEYIEIVPASGVSATTSRAMLLVEAPRSGANARVYRFSSAEQHFRSRTSNRIADIFGNHIFRRPASEVRDQANLKLPARGVQLSKLKIKIKISISQRPPSDVCKRANPGLPPQSCQHQSQQSKFDFSASAERRLHTKSCSDLSNSTSYGSVYTPKLSSLPQFELQKGCNGSFSPVEILNQRRSQFNSEFKISNITQNRRVSVISR
ncbi:hypothetical protein R3P38DRAFT_2773858 [Favolaschia claudopus]|uniref:Uncharacterized protein n=1 Tax=Favolaschia claudopus TaxID=2862362 RepID=A0AAW0C3J2_9AGAR